MKEVESQWAKGMGRKGLLVFLCMENSILKNTPVKASSLSGGEVFSVPLNALLFVSVTIGAGARLALEVPFRVSVKWFFEE